MNRYCSEIEGGGPEDCRHMCPNERDLWCPSCAAPVCGATDHPVFVYPCFLEKGHRGPHDNGSGDPWFSKREDAP